MFLKFYTKSVKNGGIVTVHGKVFGTMKDTKKYVLVSRDWKTVAYW